MNGIGLLTTKSSGEIQVSPRAIPLIGKKIERIIMYLIILCICSFVHNKIKYNFVIL